MPAASSKVTFEVPVDLKARMEDHPEVNWSGVLRQAIDRHLQAMEIARQILEEADDPRIRVVAQILKQGVGARARAERDAGRG